MDLLTYLRRSQDKTVGCNTAVLFNLLDKNDSCRKHIDDTKLIPCYRVNITLDDSQ